MNDEMLLALLCVHGAIWGPGVLATRRPDGAGPELRRKRFYACLLMRRNSVGHSASERQFAIHQHKARRFSSPSMLVTGVSTRFRMRHTMPAVVGQTSTMET